MRPHFSRTQLYLGGVLWLIVMCAIAKALTWFIYQHDASVMELAALMACLFAAAWWVELRDRARQLRSAPAAHTAAAGQSRPAVPPRAGSQRSA